MEGFTDLMEYFSTFLEESPQETGEIWLYFSIKTGEKREARSQKGTAPA
jgi:hypothetical protein